MRAKPATRIREPAAELLPLHYDELKRLAAGYMRRERGDHTLQPTALVHEAYLKLADRTAPGWKSRSHFVAGCALAMRRVLVDHARARGRAKRGADWHRVTLAEIPDSPLARQLTFEEVLHLNDALDRLVELDARQARVVELRFFGGLSVAEVAEVLDVSRRTVEGDWTHARAWLGRELASAEDG